MVGAHLRSMQQTSDPWKTDNGMCNNLFYDFILVLGARVAHSVLCLTTDWTTGVRSPAGEKDFSPSTCVQTGSGAHPASCTMGTWGALPGVKRGQGRDADHSPPSSAEVKNEQELYLLCLQAPSWRVAGQLYFPLL
jgi:hypothetical protein